MSKKSELLKEEEEKNSVLLLNILVLQLTHFLPTHIYTKGMFPFSIFCKGLVDIQKIGLVHLCA